MKHIVTITASNGQLVATPDPVLVQRQTNDWIEWKNDSNMDCWICFTSSPFDDHDFLVKAGGTLETNSVRRDANATLYAYDLVDDAKIQAGNAWEDFAHRLVPTSFGTASGVAADPQVIVH